MSGYELFDTVLRLCVGTYYRECLGVHPGCCHVECCVVSAMRRQIFTCGVYVMKDICCQDVCSNPMVVGVVSVFEYVM